MSLAFRVGWPQWFAAWAVVALVTNVVEAEEAPRKPNVLVILADDLGYADVGFNGAKDIPTPHLDALATRSIRCTDGYVSHPFCSPTRAGLLTGRYQQRFGHESNPIWNPDDPVAGLPTTETTLPEILRTAGYKTGIVGKWHLGGHPHFHPNRRGFDDFYGMLGGGHMYFPDIESTAEYNRPLERNGKTVKFTEYLTDVLGREGAAFIKRHQGQPWFLFLAFNAPHGPLQADEKRLARVSGIEDGTRRKYAGLVCGLDDAVGETLAALRESGQEDNTLVFFFSDNGGPSHKNHCDNSPLRGHKGNVYEGGVRVPFLVSWPGKLAAGSDYKEPVISLDVFATAAALGGAAVPANVKLDGVDLLPYLSGNKLGKPHDRLYWRTGGGDSLAVRQGDWKWVRMRDEKPQLFNLAKDVSESIDVAGENAAIASELEGAALAWNAELVPPLFPSPPERRQARQRRQGQGKAPVRATP